MKFLFKITHEKKNLKIKLIKIKINQDISEFSFI